MTTSQLAKVIILIFLSVPAFGQTDITDDYSDIDSTETEIFTIVEKLPVFLRGGNEGLMQIISDSLNYPITAIKDRVGGKVIVQFTVDTTGTMTDISIIQGIREDIDKESLRLVGLLNGWEPGIQNNKKVKVRYTIPLYFWIDNKFKKKYLKKYGR